MTSQPSRELGRPTPVILVVDDDAAVRSSLKFCLEIEGFVVRAFATAEHLLNEPDLPSFGCLIVDYHMPGMTGLELLAQLRSSGVDLPFILITGHPGFLQGRQAAEAGVTIVQKPLLGSSLTIRGALGAPTHGAAP